MLCQATDKTPVIPSQLPIRGRSDPQRETLPRRRVLDWLPFLWSRVLFPGSSDRPAAWRWAPFLVLCVVSGALLYPCLSFFLFEPDEGRYAQIPREMLMRGDWIVPTLQGEPYLDKPPLFYWLVMGAFQLFGFHDWAARLIPALAVQGCILMTYFFGRRLLGERPAFWGALALALAPGFVGMGRLLVLDGMLTFWVTLSIFSALRAVESGTLRRGWWLLAALACGLGVLTKGPVAIVLLLPPLWLYLRLAMRPARIGRGGWILFAGVVLTVALPWYIAVCARLPEFARHFLLVHNVQRYVQPFDHDRPVWFYIPVLFAGLLPWALLAIPFVRFLVSDDEAPKRSPALGYLLLTAAWCLVFFSLAGSKLPTYILPAFPPLALALGVFLAQCRWRNAHWFRGGIAAWWVLAIFGHGVLLPAVARARSPMADRERMTALCGDPKVPVLCFPRHVDSVAFYVGRADFPAIHTKNLDHLLDELNKNPRTVVLFGHRNSLQSLKQLLPANLKMVDTAPMGLCDLAVVERQ
jgi:4-amino-4-deoxy-L-arabinose transferase-like glycosyltransferase